MKMECFIVASWNRNSLIFLCCKTEKLKTRNKYKIVLKLKNMYKTKS